MFSRLICSGKVSLFQKKVTSNPSISSTNEINYNSLTKEISEKREVQALYIMAKGHLVCLIRGCTPA